MERQLRSAPTAALSRVRKENERARHAELVRLATERPPPPAACFLLWSSIALLVTGATLLHVAAGAPAQILLAGPAIGVAALLVGVLLMPTRARLRSRACRIEDIGRSYGEPDR